MRLFQILGFLLLLFVLRMSLYNTGQARRAAQEGHHKDETLSAANKALLKRNFAPIWTAKKLPFEIDDMGNARPEPLGYIGEHFQRFQIHFSEARQDKDNPQQYLLTGKTKVKGHVCDFTGIFTVQSIDCGQPFTLDPKRVDGELFGARTLRAGTLKGSYELKQNSAQPPAGVLKGTFTSNFLINEQGGIDYDFLRMYSDNYCNNQFEGTWTPYGTEDTQVCNWGDYRIPNSRALDMGAGEFSPDDKFLPYGWQTYREAQLADKAWWE